MLLEPPLLFPFNRPLKRGFSPFRRLSSVIEVPTYTNAQKLSLPANTAVGTRVKVSDGFVVSGFGDADGFYSPRGVSQDHPFYNLSTKPTTTPGEDDPVYCVRFETGAWFVYGNGTFSDANTTDEDFPWQVIAWNDEGSGVPALTYPAVQQLASPSSEQGGVFVSGGTQDGIYVHDPNYSPPIGQSHPERDGLILLGSTLGYPYLEWTDSVFAAWGLGPDSPAWYFATADAPIYYSLSNVATPDLASNWKNASDDSDASITVTSVTAGQIAAGIKFGSDFYTATVPVNGRNAYHDVLDVVPDFTFNGTIWTDGTHNGTGTPAFPWGVTGITVIQDDVAAEANWSNV